MLFRLMLVLAVGFYFLFLISECAHASEDSALIRMLVERDGVTPACARASLADQYTMPREQLPRNLRNSCTDDEILALALARGCVPVSINGVECAIGRRLHVGIDNDGVVNDIYLVDDVTGAFIPTGRVLQ